MLLLLSALMAVLPLAGAAYLWYVDPSLTVGKMFLTLIALAISGLFGLNTLLELRRLVRGESGGAGQAQGAGGRVSVSAASASGGALTMGALREQGVVEAVGYYESQVGRPNHSIITLRANADQSLRLVTLLGDLRDQFPVGRKVELVYRPDPQGYSLVQRRIYA